jgi:hypothetical protein
MMPDAKFEHCFGGHEPHVRKTRVTLVPGAAVFSEQLSNSIGQETHRLGRGFGACEISASAEVAFNFPAKIHDHEDSADTLWAWSCCFQDNWRVGPISGLRFGVV